ncbi:MAG: alanyl-tRNA editing protein [Azospirillaceae bacterium]|nr:alanyl-tRNA editing protein [Azospirillaceae bacterium]
MTEKVFWNDPCLTRLETRIAGVAGDIVTVERTIFYAFSGGQESDQGTIGGVPVLKAAKSGQDIDYTLPAGHGLRPGDAVTIAIDGVRRRRLMRLHFAAEVILVLILRAAPGIAKIGAHIAADKARIDFAWDHNLATLFAELQGQADALIAADLPIISAFSDRERQYRYWEVAGFARVPCGGTHLKTTGEVGALDLKRRNPGKGKERVEITLVDPDPR